MPAAAIAAGVRKCQDLPALEEDGGDAEDLSLSLWSLSSVDTGAAGLLWETENEEMLLFISFLCGRKVKRKVILQVQKFPVWSDVMYIVNS